MPAKERLDLALLTRGLSESRSQAQRLIMAGQVRVNDQVVIKPASLVEKTDTLTVHHGPRFVSRGGNKLLAALQAFSIPVKDRICADVGASTGGFTDCLLQHEAKRVYAIDVGRGILEWKLRQDPRVVVMEGTNARQVERLAEQVSLITIDASFISLKILLPVTRGWLTLPETTGLHTGDIIALIKPQFEAGRSLAARGKGVIRDPVVHQQVLEEVLSFAVDQRYGVQGIIRSPILGPKGNVEFLTWLTCPQGEKQSLTQFIQPLFNTTSDWLTDCLMESE